jgi:hypothetical protein
LWGKKLGFETLEYACMPMGELTDLIDLYMASEGLVEVRKDINSGNGIPRELR